MVDDPRDFDRMLPEDIEPGEPIAQLRDLDEETSPSFVVRVRSKILRRTLASQFTSLFWSIPEMLFVEFWNFVAGLLKARDTKEGGPQ